MARYIFREKIIGLIRDGQPWQHPYHTPVELTDAEVEQIREAGAMHAILRVDPMVAPVKPDLDKVPAEYIQPAAGATEQAEAPATPAPAEAPAAPAPAEAPAAPAPAPAPAEDEGEI